MSNSQHKKRLLEALEFAERMALSTVFDDKALKKSLFKLGYLYGKEMAKESLDRDSDEEKTTGHSEDSSRSIDDVQLPA